MNRRKRGHMSKESLTLNMPPLRLLSSQPVVGSVRKLPPSISDLLLSSLINGTSPTAPCFDPLYWCKLLDWPILVTTPIALPVFQYLFWPQRRPPGYSSKFKSTKMLRLKRGLKRARLFEIQKITRRVKLLEGKRGTEPQVQKNRRKARRLLEELEFIKNLDLSDVAEKVLETVSTEGDLLAVNTSRSDLSESARWRLLNSNVFQQVIKHIQMEEVKKVREEKNFAKSEEVSGDQTTFIGDWLLEQNDSDLVKQSDQLHKSLNNIDESVVNSEKQYSNSEHNEHAIDEHKRRGSNAKRITRDTERAGGTTRSSERKEFLESDSLTASCRGDMKLDSVFLESLEVCGKEHQPQIKKCQQPHPMKRRNRPGQRARQKKWELLYGSRAKHLKKKQKPKDMMPSNKVSKVITSKTHRADGDRSSDQLEASSSLHPSWAAIRQKKAKEGGIREFQGQRIVFSDSD